MNNNTKTQEFTVTFNRTFQSLPPGTIASIVKVLQENDIVVAQFSEGLFCTGNMKEGERLLRRFTENYTCIAIRAVQSK